MIFSTILFYVLALVLVVAAFRVITANSPVTGVLHLILTFFTASMIWMLQGAEFLSLLLVLVYVGAVMVLFLFVVMMLDVRMDALRAGMKTYLPMGLIIGLIMVLEMAFVLAKSWLGAGPAAVIADDVDNTHALGVAMYTDYVFAVQIGGVILLVGMIAAIALTLRKRADVKRTNPSEQVKVKAQDRLRMVSIPSQTEAPAAANADQAQGDKQ
ncbi:NADH-ubiquinone oxidoreductase, chain J [Pusillimonas sp. T7-7]|uniref:NADH-quinone oxidoreductase subunit J n=1 Tax=Pusillimonas sp. (strain T7-7) TaxID=1007105 RepID=UPI00020856AE|nr:NADH-quinone oxidoreductase subunit J [Pusillimonas sp. T7-7]AEC20295.1 NADH-ubiquinone oxidoreductase, chain J [Pusillimonas sp. T7-7]